MEAGVGSEGPPRPKGEDSDKATNTSGFSMSPSSPSQSPHALNRSVEAAMDPGTSDLPVSPSSPLQSVLRPTVNTTAGSPPSPPSSGSVDSQSPLKSALRKPNSPQNPKISRRVSIEQNVQIDIDSRRSRDRFSSSQQSAASNDSARSGLGDSGVSLRFRRTPTNSKTSNRSSFALRDTVLSRMSSNVGGLRESFFGAIGRTTTVHDPLELSPNQEFDLDVIDESGGMDENIGQILKPQVDFSNWSREGYIVLGFGVVLLVLMVVLAETVGSLNGYNIDPGLVFGSLLTLILCVCVFVTYHGVQSYQRHPNPLIYYKCVIDIFLSLRFLLDPLLQDMGVYRVGDEASCAYLSGITQFLYLSSDCWYFAQIVDLYWSLTNPFMSVKANRRRFKMMVYSAGAFTGIFAAFVPGVHGFADGNYCWTKRKTTDDADSMERDLFHLNPGNWLLFYMWMILFYLSGVAVLIFGVKRLRSGLRDTLNSRREMLRNGALSIMSYTIYWTIVFFWYAMSFRTHTTYDKDGNFAPSLTFRTFTFTLSARGAIDYFVWFMVNSPSLVRPNWLKFSSDSADKQYSAQLNTALQEELIYFTIEGMTRAIQIAEQDLIRIRDRSPTQELVLGISDEEDDHPPSLAEAATVATGLPGAGSTSTLLQSVQRNRMLSTITEAINAGLHRNSSADAETRRAKNKNSKEPDFSFDIPQDQRSIHSQQPKGDRRVQNPSSASTVVTTADPPSPAPAVGTTTASIRFTPYKPQAFAELRQAYGIKALDFMKSFQTSTKPNISEGASGAFMFFSGDKKYIVKSMAEEEARFLCEIAEKYAEYLTMNPSSLITKFYGCFKITMYDKRFYFIVMENLFDVMEEGVQIHHRFDIKGSWVNRSYKRPRRGAKVKCRHCSMMFKYGAKKSLIQCPNVVGLHEPNVVLKDNDLRTRMRIGMEEGVELYEQLRDDSLFLCDLGIMDYSLLLGVMDIEFAVDQPSENSSLSERTAANTAINTGTGTNSATTNSLTNDSFISASSSGWSSSTGSSSSESMPKKLGMNVAPSVHSLFNQPEDPLNQSRYPSSGGEPRPKRSMRKSKRVFGPGYYYVGIIDILQTWTLQKKLERFWKVDIQQKDGEGLSAIDPVRYQRRFEGKLREIIAIPKEYYHRQRRNQPKNAMFQSVQRLSPVLQAAAAFENAAAAKEARRSLPRERGDSTDTDTSGTSSSAAEDGDLEQAGRNPTPILLPFNQRLITTNSMRSQLSMTDLAV